MIKPETGQIRRHVRLPGILHLRVAEAVRGQERGEQGPPGKLNHPDPEGGARVVLAQACGVTPVRPAVPGDRAHRPAVRRHGDDVAVADLREHRVAFGEGADQQGRAVGGLRRQSQLGQHDALGRGELIVGQVRGDGGIPPGHDAGNQPAPRALLDLGRAARYAPRPDPHGRDTRGDGHFRAPVAAEVPRVTVPVGDGHHQQGRSAGQRQQLVGYRVLVGAPILGVRSTDGAGGVNLPRERVARRTGLPGATPDRHRSAIGENNHAKWPSGNTAPRHLPPGLSPGIQATHAAPLIHDESILCPNLTAREHFPSGA